MSTDIDVTSPDASATPALGNGHKGPVLSVLDLVPVSAGRSRAQALTEMVELARTVEDAGYERYWIAEHHGSSTFLAAATTVLMGRVLDSTKRIQVVAGGVMLPNHPPLVVAEQIGTLATMHPGRVGLGMGRAPGTDRLTAKALRRRAADPASFSDEVLETLGYLDAPATVTHVPGSLSTQMGLLSRAGRDTAVNPRLSDPTRPVVRALAGEGIKPPVWILGSSVNGARVAGRLGLPFVASAHFAPQQAEAAIMAYRSVFDATATSAQVRQPSAAVAVQVAVAPTRAEARRLFTTAQMAAARLVAGNPGPLDPPSAELYAWKSLVPGKEALVQASLAGALVGEAAEVADGLRALAQSWDLNELVLLSNIHDAQARRDSYALLAEQW
ncbi:Limonene 1,2-monooxygenase [Actinomyces bovis]|uniref:Limonene 1,2-monooxygenase n=1 Tax=Actinomyces bovis TaxID=1658 RepID=A0ABY1VM74_9ACTO|nr:MsnO8 family LLM class oxidoreductase [Actinomyces bovis]SPT53209.1 Limonene 1,2-monooxygenase [Actinomyces bovis]VEG52435.1 Limonene 1,2-monooxygenase [Actinomyces israelii]